MNTKSIDKEVLPGNWFENEWRKLEEKGLNPSAMEELYKALEGAIDTIYTFKTAGMDNIVDRVALADNDREIQLLKQALKKAKI